MVSAYLSDEAKKVMQRDKQKDSHVTVIYFNQHIMMFASV
jgi:hypothetical protein